MSTAPPSLREILLGLLDPWLFLGSALSHLPATLLRDPAALLSPARLQSAWFGAFWARAGLCVRASAEARVVPLLQGRWRSGRVVSDESDVDPPVAGTVVEIGPGAGMWVSLFSDRYLQSSSGGGACDGEGAQGGGGDDPDSGVRRRGAAAPGGVTKVFGVEPNADMHGMLGERIREAGLEGVYEIVPVGIEDLASSGRVQLESVDCIVSILCLCGIPDPEWNIKELYRYLKPGGRWYVYEHVKSAPAQGWAMRVYQGMRDSPTAVAPCGLVPKPRQSVAGC